MRRLAAILGVMVAATASPQAASLRGLVLANELGGPPLANISVAADGANDTRTDDQGRFVLDFPARQPGDAVRVMVNQPGQLVVNDLQLEATLPGTNSSARLVVLLCRPEAREEMARRFYRLKSFEAIEARYQEQLRELQAKGGSTGEQLARLQQERGRAKAAAEKGAEELARVKPGDASELHQQAMRLFVAGKVEEALRVLDDGKLSQAAEAAKHQTRQVVENYLLKARILTTQLKFDEADDVYRRATNAVPESFEACFGYAVFSQELNRHHRARPVYERALALARLSGAETDVAMTLNNLGLLQRDQNRMEEAGQAFAEALKTYRKLAETHPDTYLPDVAMMLDNLGNLQSDQNRMEEASKAYAEALTIRRKLAENNPGAYLPDLATTLNNLGNLHRAQNRMVEAGQLFAEVLITYRKLAESNPDTYLPDVATTLNNLGILHHAQNRMPQAGEAFAEALKIRRKLAEANPDTYLPEVATTLNNLGVLDSDQNRMTEAGQAFAEALKIRRKLAETNPDTYQPDIATTLNNLGVLHSEQNRMADAKHAYTEALNIRRKLAEASPDTYLPDVATTLNNLGVLHRDEDRVAEARQAFSEALTIYRAFAAKNPARYQGDVERVEHLLKDLKTEAASAK
jgi:Tfp pilus assembly protein PilF